MTVTAALGGIDANAEMALMTTQLEAYSMTPPAPNESVSVNPAPHSRARDLLSIESRLNLVFGLMMSAFMAMVLSGVMTWFNSPAGQFGLLRWGRSFTLAWPIAFTLLLTVGPRIRRLAMWLVDRWAALDRN